MKGRVLVFAAVTLSFGCLSFGCRRTFRSGGAHAAVRPNARHVFVDGGAHLGETVLSFEKSKLYAAHRWEIVSFEPNPELVPQIPKRPNLTLMQAAIWTSDGELEFHFSDHETLGGSVMDSFVPLPEMQAVKVKSIDFGAWLKKSFRKDDVVFVKLDIEGAEYPVLQQMLRDGSIAWVDRLYLEFHGVQQAAAAKAADWQIVEQKKKDDELLEAITTAGVPVSLHQNEEPQGRYFDFEPEKYGLKPLP